MKTPPKKRAKYYEADMKRVRQFTAAVPPKGPHERARILLDYARIIRATHTTKVDHILGEQASGRPSATVPINLPLPLELERDRYLNVCGLVHQYTRATDPKSRRMGSAHLIGCVSMAILHALRHPLATEGRADEGVLQECAECHSGIDERVLLTQFGNHPYSHCHAQDAHMPLPYETAQNPITQKLEGRAICVECLVELCQNAESMARNEHFKSWSHLRKEIDETTSRTGELRPSVQFCRMVGRLMNGTPMDFCLFSFSVIVPSVSVLDHNARGIINAHHQLLREHHQWVDQKTPTLSTLEMRDEFESPSDLSRMTQCLCAMSDVYRSTTETRAVRTDLSEKQQNRLDLSVPISTYYQTPEPASAPTPPLASETPLTFSTTEEAIAYAVAHQTTAHNYLRALSMINESVGANVMLPTPPALHDYLKVSCERCGLMGHQTNKTCPVFYNGYNKFTGGAVEHLTSKMEESLTTQRKLIDALLNGTNELGQALLAQNTSGHKRVRPQVISSARNRWLETSTQTHKQAVRQPYRAYPTLPLATVLEVTRARAVKQGCSPEQALTEVSCGAFFKDASAMRELQRNWAGVYDTTDDLDRYVYHLESCTDCAQQPYRALCHAVEGQIPASAAEATTPPRVTPPTPASPPAAVKRRSSSELLGLDTMFKGGETFTPPMSLDLSNDPVPLF